MNTSRKPLKTALTTSDKILESLCWGALGLLWLAAFWVYSQLPEIIPTHFNGAGEIDGYGPKYSLLFLPGLATIFILLFVLLKRSLPGLIYLEEGITTANAEKKYRFSLRGLRLARLFLTLMFSVIFYFVVKSAQVLQMPAVSTNWSGTVTTTLLTMVFVLSLPVIVIILLSRNSGK